MNFIAHFFFTHQPEQHYYNLGTVLPDLARNFVKGSRIAPHKTVPLQPEHQQLNEGSAMHYALDKVFHNSQFFNSSYAHIRELTRQAGFDSSFPKYFFFNHIFLELMLDRYLIRQHPQSATEFYRSLHVIEPQPLKDFLQLHDIVQGEEFFTKFERFRDVKYLFHYPDNEKMIYSLNRIMMQVGLFGLSAHNQKLLLPVMEQTDEWMQQQFKVLENEMNQFRTQSI